jgi:hypothetical protein
VNVQLANVKVSQRIVVGTSFRWHDALGSTTPSSALPSVKNGDHSVRIDIFNVTRTRSGALGQAYRRDVGYVNFAIAIRIT